MSARCELVGAFVDMEYRVRMSTPPSAQTEPPRIPYMGFRVVFALVNAIIWFSLAFGITTGISFGVVQSGRLTSKVALVFACTVAFFVFFFGLSGGLPGFLDQARQGRIALPSEDSHGPGGALASVWRVGFVRGAIASALVYGVSRVWADAPIPLSRGSLCLFLGGLAAVLAFVNALLASRPSSLGDLRPRKTPPSDPTNAYLMQRVGLPQAFGNGTISALVDVGTFPLGEAATRAPMNTAIDSLMTGLIIALFTVFTAGGLVGTERRLGHLKPLVGTRPSVPKRLLLVFGVSALGAGIAFVLASVADGLTLMMAVVWKVLLASGIAAFFGLLAARWEISEES